MTRWVLNSAVIASGGYGRYDYAPATADEARAWLREPGWVSRVGYPDTAAWIRRLAGVEVPLLREASQLAPGDEALIVRLRYRLGDPSAKGRHAPAADDYEIAWLRRIT